jgi:hypothetical protein
VCAVRSALVVALRGTADPIGGISYYAGNDFGGQPARQEPQEVLVAALNRIPGAPVASSKLLDGQVQWKRNASCKSPFYNSATRHGIIRSRAVLTPLPATSVVRERLLRSRRV